MTFSCKTIREICIAFTSLSHYNKQKEEVYMSKTATINMRIEPTIKAQAEDVFSSFGISVTDAINIFLHASIMEGGFPFQPKQPRYNRETLLAMQEAREIMDGKIEAKRYTSLSELMDEMDAEECNA